MVLTTLREKRDAYVKKRIIRNFFPYKVGVADYLSNISIKNKYVYMETPKVACSTIKKCLHLMEFGGTIPSEYGCIHNKRQSPLYGLLDFDNDDIINLFDGDDYFRFSFVRNPFTRVLSAYLDKIHSMHDKRDFFLAKAGLPSSSPVTFFEFLNSIKNIPDYEKDIHWAPLSYLLQAERVNYHFLGRFENITKSMHLMLLKIGVHLYDKDLYNLREDSHKTNSTSLVSEYIGRKERDLIIEIYEKDFSNFCYSYDPFFAAV